MQMTEFEGGGLAIGISCSHMLADAACLTMLVQSWADMSLLGKVLSPPDFHAFPAKRITNASGHHRPYLDPSTASLGVPGRLSTATLAFSDESVRSIVDDSRAAPDGSPPSTAFQALAALFWTSISGVKGRRGSEGLVDMSICSDAREALDLSKSFFGNAMVFNGVQGGGIGEGRLDMAVKAIADVMSKLDKEGVVGFMEWLEAHGETPRRTLCGPRLLCANWEGLRPYVAAFEPGVRPIHVSYYLEPAVGEGQVLVLPSARGHVGSLSRVVMVTLPEEQLGILCEDPCVLRYGPEILMGPQLDPIKVHEESNLA